MGKGPSGIRAAAAVSLLLLSVSPEGWDGYGHGPYPDYGFHPRASDLPPMPPLYSPMPTPYAPMPPYHDYGSRYDFMYEGDYRYRFSPDPWRRGAPPYRYRRPPHYDFGDYRYDGAGERRRSAGRREEGERSRSGKGETGKSDPKKTVTVRIGRDGENPVSARIREGLASGPVTGGPASSNGNPGDGEGRRQQEIRRERRRQNPGRRDRPSHLDEIVMMGDDNGIDQENPGESWRRSRREGQERMRRQQDRAPGRQGTLTFGSYESGDRAEGKVLIVPREQTPGAGDETTAFLGSGTGDDSPAPPEIDRRPPTRVDNFENCGILNLFSSVGKGVPVDSAVAKVLIVGAEGAIHEAQNMTDPPAPSGGGGEACVGGSTVGGGGMGESEVVERLRSCFDELVDTVTMGGRGRCEVFTRMYDLDPVARDFFGKLLTVMGEAQPHSSEEMGAIMKVIENRKVIGNRRYPGQVGTLDVVLEKYAFSIYNNDGVEAWKRNLKKSSRRNRGQMGTLDNAIKAFMKQGSATFRPPEMSDATFFCSYSIEGTSWARNDKCKPPQFGKPIPGVSVDGVQIANYDRLRSDGKSYYSNMFYTNAEVTRINRMCGKNRGGYVYNKNRGDSDWKNIENCSAVR